MKAIHRLAWVSVVMPGLAVSCELEDISHLVSAQKVYLNFQQTKQVASLSRALISTGVIWMSSEDEENLDSTDTELSNANIERQMVWQVQRPIKSTLVISTAKVKQFNRRDELLPAINNQIVTDLAEIFLSLLGGEFDELQRSFSQSLSCNNDAWVLRLEPLSDTLQSLFNYIELAGSESLQAISFQEQRGDITDISFTTAINQVPDFEAYLD